ncbi:MAG: MCE family protein, partial [Deinococcales bacterium]|nr:MCE family protein [Chitinophagaceae bacterium]
MKITNETKVGAITVISVALLILGFNFLKGKKLWSKDTMLTGKYGNVQGLQNSNPIIINGLQVGTVYKITTEKDMREILVDLNITKDINIPKNSIAIIKSNPLGTTSIEIKLGDAVENLKDKDIILTETSGGLFDNVLKKVDPVLYEVRKAVSSVDTLLANFNTILDPRAKGNIAQV